MTSASEIPTLETDRLTLRAPGPQDIDPMLAFYASDRSRFVGGPLTADLAWRQLATEMGHWALRGFGRYVMALHGAPIGHVGPLAPDANQTPEMTWSIWRDDAEGKGYATEAAKAVCHHLLAEEGWPELLVRVQPDNHGSCRIAERLGAELTDWPAPDWYPGALTYRLREEALA